MVDTQCIYHVSHIRPKRRLYLEYFFPLNKNNRENKPKQKTNLKVQQKS